MSPPPPPPWRRGLATRCLVTRPWRRGHRTVSLNRVAGPWRRADREHVWEQRDFFTTDLNTKVACSDIPPSSGVGTRSWDSVESQPLGTAVGRRHALHWASG